MKILKYTATIIISLSLSLSAQIGATLKTMLDKIKEKESSEHSKAILDLNLTRHDRMYVTSKAIETKNVDLIRVVEQSISKIDWKKHRTWEEGVKLGMHTELEALVKTNSPIVNNYKTYFLNAPDVPYERLTDWHVGYMGRGMQGSILEPIAKHNPDKFKEFTKLLDDPAVSLSKKRTIMWAMQYDTLGSSEEIMVKNIKKSKGEIKKDYERFLSNLKHSKKYKKEQALEKLVKDKKLLGTPLDELQKEIGLPESINKNVYTYFKYLGVDGEVFWTLTISNGKVTNYKRHDPSKGEQYSVTETLATGKQEI